MKKWLADGSDDDVLIDVESEEDDEQNVAIETKNWDFFIILKFK